MGKPRRGFIEKIQKCIESRTVLICVDVKSTGENNEKGEESEEMLQ